MDELTEEAQPLAPEPERRFIPPTLGEQITSDGTGNTYEIRDRIGEGNFGIAFHCIDVWGNQLAAKVLKPKGSYEKVRESALAEFQKLLVLRHPNVTYVFDTFEFRDTFYIIRFRTGPRPG